MYKTFFKVITFTWLTVSCIIINANAQTTQVIYLHDANANLIKDQCKINITLKAKGKGKKSKLQYCLKNYLTRSGEFLFENTNIDRVYDVTVESEGYLKSSVSQKLYDKLIIVLTRDPAKRDYETEKEIALAKQESIHKEKIAKKDSIHTEEIAKKDRQIKGYVSTIAKKDDTIKDQTRIITTQEEHLKIQNERMTAIEKAEASRRAKECADSTKKAEKKCFIFQSKPKPVKPKQKNRPPFAVIPNRNQTIAEQKNKNQ